MNKKVLITATVQDHIVNFHLPLITWLKENGCEVHIAAKDDLEGQTENQMNIADKVFDVPFARSPKSSDNIKAYKMLKSIISENDYDIIHCNTPMGGVVTRLAAREAKKTGTKVIYTAHGFHFFKGAPLTNWLFYFPVEWFCSFFTDELITINQEDFAFAKKHLHARKTDYVHGVGADEERYSPYPKDFEFKKSLGFDEDDFLIICTGELNKNKNQITLIKALSKIKNANIKVMFAGSGNTEHFLKEQMKILNLQDRVVFLGYVSNLEKYLNVSDLVCSMSLREGLPMNIAEGMISKKPVICSDNRGHRDLIDNGQGGYLVDALDYTALAQKIEYLYSEKNKLAQMAEHNLKRVQPFTTQNAIKDMIRIYTFI